MVSKLLVTPTKSIAAPPTQREETDGHVLFDVIIDLLGVFSFWQLFSSISASKCVDLKKKKQKIRITIFKRKEKKENKIEII